MSLATDELLRRMAGTLRHDIGPAVGDPFARTQAFMAAVILAKVAGQIASAPADARAEAAEHGAVAAAIRDLLGATGPARVTAAVDRLDVDGGPAAWSAVIEASYASRAELGPEVFARLLGVIRATLRARLDRALVYAR